MPLPSIRDPSRSERIEFSNDEIARYSRDLIMPEVTLEGQKRLKAASVLCIGAGGLGSPIALFFAAGGGGGGGVGGGAGGGWGSSMPMWSISRISSGRFCMARRTWAARS